MSELLQNRPGFWRGLLDAVGQDAAAARDWFISNMQRASGGGILNEGETDTGARAGAGMSLAGAAMTGAMPGGVFAAPRGAVMGAGPIRAYHGSPHDFDRFDIKKIGTGEGAQAYGHGLYFAENEGVARAYRDQLAKGFAGTDGAPLPRAMQQALEFVHPKFKGTGDMRAGLEDAIRRMADQSEFYRKTYGDGWNIYDGALEKLRAVDPATIKPAGRMYEVAIHADPERFLDWDKPLAQQALKSEAVDQVLSRAPAAPAGRGAAPRPYTLDELREYGATGRELYDRLSWAAGKPGAFPEINVSQPRGASQVLRDAGIPGIRYLDAGSRGAGDGSRNYVVFDDKLIEILRKYGLIPAVTGTGMGLAVDSYQQKQGPAEQ